MQTEWTREKCKREILEHNEAAGGGDIAPDKLDDIAKQLQMIHNGGLSDVTVAMMLSDYSIALAAARKDRS